MFKNTHQGPVPYGRKKFFHHIIRVEQVDILTVFHNGAYADMGMFTATGNSRYRFSLEGDFQAVFTKGFANNNTRLNFVICRLNGIGREFPVYFQLFKNEDKFT